ncbi:MAG: polysaccharide deacetylase family protein [Planctomycetes bacterium]|nr:polysaccharide deacetylase family protein [Planctomycetota bacterium]
MLPFRILTILLVGLGVYFFLLQELLAAVTSIVLLGGVITYGVTSPRSSLLCPLQWKLQDSKSVALTFDDGPDPKVTPIVLDLLKEHDIKGTFFLIGKEANKNIELVKRIVNEGHTLGNHSFNHAFATNLFSYSKLRGDITCASDALKQTCGQSPLRFRPPMGLKNPRVAKVAKELGLIVTTWSLKYTKDSTLEGGDIILFHDGYYLFGNSRPQDDTPALLSRAIQQIKTQQLNTVALS